MQVGDREAVDVGFALGEGFVVFAIETGDDIGGNTGVGHYRLDMFQAIGVELCVVVSVHHFQHLVASCLQGDVEVGQEGP